MFEFEKQGGQNNKFQILAMTKFKRRPIKIRKQRTSCDVIGCKTSANKI